MGAFELMKELRGAGVIVRSDGGVLDISPADRLTGEMIEALKLNKPEILALLKTEDAQLFGNAGQLKPRPGRQVTENKPLILGEQWETAPSYRQEWKPDKCNRCAHLSRFAGGNVCLTDNGLALLYGFSHEVPDDHGATCASWQAVRWGHAC